MLSLNGLKYEIVVYEELKKFDRISQDFCVIGDRPSGGFNRHDIDLSFKYKENVYNVEIKMSGKDQMGGTSISYDMETEQFNFVKNVNTDTENMIIEALYPMKDDLNSLLKYIKEDDMDYHKSNTGFPFRVLKDKWLDVKEQGLLKPLNGKVSRDASFIHDHYYSKNVHYIQIGGMGLFYLKENPLNLNIPQLSGDVNLEIRAGRSGSRKILIENKEYKSASVNLRVQGRLNFKGQSPYTLDDFDSIKKLFK